MKTYTPTDTPIEKELEEMWFGYYTHGAMYIRFWQPWVNNREILFEEGNFYLWEKSMYNRFYPQEKADILKVFALFTPND